MNNKGQSLGLAIMSAIFILIVGLVILNFIMPEITTFRTEMQCANPSVITDSTKLLCLMTDATVPYWILLVFSLAIGGITARLF